ncbi:MAG: hypothetical protein RLZZ318_749 [Bacteroidota bacterium]
MKKLTYLCLAIGLCFQSVQAQTETPHIHYLSDPDAAERQHSVDIQHMKVQVSFKPEAATVLGKVTHQFVTIQNHIDTLFFDAPGIQIHSALLDGLPVPFTIQPDGVVVRFTKSLMWDEQHSIVFEYTAMPKKGIYFIGWNQPENKQAPDINYIRKQIWTQGQGIDNRHWIPMYDCMNDKFTTETVVTIPLQYKCLSNGKLVSNTDNGTGTATWHYQLEKPHAGYLLMLGIGDYAIKSTTTKRGTPVQFWYYPEFKDRVETTSLYTERMIELLEDETGTPYPWGSYSQIMVQNFLYGAMENTSATIFGDFFTVDARGFKDRNYMGVNCHELTHQWFGDLITARSGNDVWLQESFATFFPKLFFQWLEGDDAYQWAMRGEYNSALAQSEKDNFPVRHTKGGTTRLYPKGSAVLGMLRYQLGPENFTRFIQHYLAVNGFKNVESWDFQKALKDKLGLNYDWFFDQWIHRGGEPHYKVSYTTQNNQVLVNIAQTHKTDGHVRYFKMPVDFAVYYKNGQVDRKTVWVMDSAQQTIALPKANADIDFVLFDEQNKVMKKMDFAKSPSELMAQAAKAKYMIDRYDAVAAMKDLPIKDKQTLLMARFTAEKHPAIRAEIAKQLANQPKHKLFALIIKDTKAEVKNAFIAADTLVLDHVALYEQLLKDSSYSVVENALDKLVNASKVEPAVKLKALASVSTVSGQNNNVHCKYLEHSIAQKLNVNANLEALTVLCGPNYEFRTRVAAAQAIKRLNVFSPKIAEHLIEACLTYNSRLYGPCSDVLKTLKKQNDYNVVLQNAIQALSSEQQSTLKNLGLKD